MKNLVALASGLLFAVGLGLSGMTKPSKVYGFLNVAGDWDPSLAFVMGGAVVVGVLASLLMKRMKRPALDEQFCLPEKRDVDARLILGAAIFGVGWGLGGVCPGPGVVALASGALPVVVFVAAMLGGMALYRLYDKLASRLAISADG